MTDEELDAWAEEVLDRIRLHRRRDVQGLLSMLDDDLADCLDALAVAPLLADEIERLDERAEYEARRLRHLDEIEIDWKRIEREAERERRESERPL
jgi:hypothetical protein